MRRVLVLCTVITMVLSSAGPALALPANDDLAAATEVFAVPFTDMVDTTDATTENDEPVEPGCPPRGATVWYALSVETAQTLAIDTAGSNYDTTLAVYTGNHYSDLALIECVDDTFDSSQAALTLTVEAGAIYLIQVGTFGGDFGGELHISIVEPQSPDIPPFEKATGQPNIFMTQSKELAAISHIEVAEETKFYFAEIAMFDGRHRDAVRGASQEGGKPDRFTEGFVIERVTRFDDGAESGTVTQWFGGFDLNKGEFGIDKKLGSAWVVKEVVLQGWSCTHLGEECTFLGTADVTVDVTWDGVGEIEEYKVNEKEIFGGVEWGFLRFWDRFSGREANVSGGWSGDRTGDITGGSGFLVNQAQGELTIFHGASLP